MDLILLSDGQQIPLILSQEYWRGPTGALGKSAYLLKDFRIQLICPPVTGSTDLLMALFEMMLMSVSLVGTPSFLC